MPITTSSLKDSARVYHTGDDAHIALLYDAVVRELEERTGWCLDVVTRTQYVPEQPYGVAKLVRLERQPVSAATCLDRNSNLVSLSLVTINGIQYADMDAPDLKYPLTITMTCGSGTVHPLLGMAIRARVTQLNAARGDDTVPLRSDYWDNVCAMMGKGIG